MSFKFHCTNCGQKVEAEAEHIGQNMSCPSCSQSLIVTAPSDTADHTPPPLEVVNWHYELDGNPTGPVPENQIKEFIAAGKITRTTRVWCKGMTSWTNAGETSLKGLFPASGSYSADQIKNTAKKLLGEGRKVSLDAIEKSSPFIKTQVVPRIKTPRYAILILCCLTFVVQCSKQAGIEERIKVLQSNSPTDGALGSFLQGVASISLGDYMGGFSKAGELWKMGNDQSRIDAYISQLKSASEAAGMWEVWAVIFGLIAIFRIAIVHRQIKRGTRKPFIES